MVNLQVEKLDTVKQRNAEQKTVQLSQSYLENKPFKLLKFMESLITENLVKEINRVYEFHIIKDFEDQTKEKKCDIFYLDIKNEIKSRVLIETRTFTKSDCIIKLNEESLNDLLNDNLTPFTAYLSGKIEIEGDLNDVFKLKKLIKSIPSNFNNLNSF